jgi:tetratricopeptide (TPR) repeat protein
MVGKSSDPTESQRPFGRTWVLCALIAVAGCVVYLPVLEADFITTWDDNVFITDNRDLQAPDALKRIWTTPEMPKGYPNYPLVFTTYRIEYLLWELNPVGYHAVNVLLHALSGVLLFFVLRSLRAPQGLSAVVALLFVVHPMQVESVAWITERKIVLFAPFFLGAFLAYRRFREKESWFAYGLCLLLFVLALLSKTTAITLVASLFIADWILDKRRRLGEYVQLLPMLAAGLAAVYVTTLVEYAETSAPVRLAFRPFLIARTTWFYIGKLLWPDPLVPVYEKWSGIKPYSVHEPQYLSPPFFIALLALISVMYLLWRYRHRLAPLSQWGLGHLFVTLLPVLGIVHFAYQSHSFVADRYVYLAVPGFYLAIGAILARPFSDATATKGRQSFVLAASAALVVVLGVMTWHQAGLWRDSKTLWEHTLRHNDDSHEAHNVIGTVLTHQGRTDEALRHFERALEIKPNKYKCLNNLGNLYFRKGQYEEAIAAYKRVLEFKRDYAMAHFNLGKTYLELDQLEPAEQELRQAISLDQNYVKAHHYLGVLYGERGQHDAATEQFERTLELDPCYGPSYYHLLKTMAARWEFESMPGIVARGERRCGGSASVLDSLAWMLATWPEPHARNGAEALRLASRACELEQPPTWRYLATLAAAQAEARKFDEALRTAERALSVIPAQAQPEADYVRQMIDSFRAGRPVGAYDY